MADETENPEQSYFPAAKVRLIIRFDEYREKSKVVAGEAGKVPPQLLKGVKGKIAPLEPIPDPHAPEGVKRFLLLPKGAVATDKTISPQKLDRSKDGLTFVVGAIIPKEAQLGLNGIRQADTLSVGFKYIDLPIDPRTVRACGVEFYLGTLPFDDFQNGLAGVQRGTGNGNSSSEFLSVIPDEYTDANGQKRSNLRFLGFVDKWEVEWGEGEPYVRLECRDNTTLVIDQQAPPNLYIGINDPIDLAIAKYLSNFNKMAGLTVEYRPAGADVPKLSDALSKTTYRPQLGPPPGGAGGEMTCWDYLTDVCGSLGHTCRLEGITVVVQRVRTVTSGEFIGRSSDPFKGRTLAESGRVLDVRNFIYGRNILSLKFGRTYTVNALQSVEVRCYSPKRKKVLVARFPLAGDQVFGLTVRPGDIADQKWTVYRISGVEDEKILRVYAQGIFEQVNRGEMTTNVKTRNLASFGGNNLDPDILDMQAGDTFEVQVNRDEEQFGSLTQIETMLLVQARSEQFLTSLGYDGEFASAYARAYANVGFQTKFRLKQLGISWSVDGGVDLELGGVNYLEVRGDALLPKGEEQSPPPGNKPNKATQ